MFFTFSVCRIVPVAVVEDVTHSLSFASGEQYLPHTAVFWLEICIIIYQVYCYYYDY